MLNWTVGKSGLGKFPKTSKLNSYIIINLYACILKSKNVQQALLCGQVFAGLEKFFVMYLALFQGWHFTNTEIAFLNEFFISFPNNPYT